MQILGLLALHVICLYFLRLLWRDKNDSLKRSGMLTKMGYVSKKKSPRLFYLSAWFDFLVLCVLYGTFIVISFLLLLR
jgi:hypothetical protein